MMLGLGRESQDEIKELEITKTEVLHATVDGGDYTKIEVKGKGDRKH